MEAIPQPIPISKSLVAGSQVALMKKIFIKTIDEPG